MELVFAAVGIFYLFVVVFGWALGDSADHGDHLWADALNDEAERDWQWPRQGAA